MSLVRRPRRQIKQLPKENRWLKRLVAEWTLDKKCWASRSGLVQPPGEAADRVLDPVYKLGPSGTRQGCCTLYSLST